VANRRRVSKTITLPAELVEKLDAEAIAVNRSVSQLIEARLLDVYQGGPTAGLDRLEAVLNNFLTEFRTTVMPVVVKVARYLQQLEGDVPAAVPASGPIKVACAEDIYGADYAQPKPEPRMPAQPTEGSSRRWKRR
jgi:hypothetical protein